MLIHYWHHDCCRTRSAGQRCDRCGTIAFRYDWADMSTVRLPPPVEENAADGRGFAHCMARHAAARRAASADTAVEERAIPAEDAQLTVRTPVGGNTFEPPPATHDRTTLRRWLLVWSVAVISAGLSGIYSLGTVVEFERGRALAALICALGAAARGLTLVALLLNAPDFAGVRKRLWNAVRAPRALP